MGFGATALAAGPVNNPVHYVTVHRGEERDMPNIEGFAAMLMKIEGEPEMDDARLQIIKTNGGWGFWPTRRSTPATRLS